MNGNKKLEENLTRRRLLKFGAAGLGTFCLGGLVGCDEQREKNEDPVSRKDAGEKGLIGAVESPWYSELDNNSVRCELCPKKCELAEGERSPCRVRENRDGACYSLVYGNPALVQEDPVERKPFFHVLPGSRALSVSTAGCNLSCKFCEVWDMALVAPEDVYAYDMPPERVIEQALAANVRSISYAFGEPVVYHEYLEALASLAREAGFMNLVHTAAYIEQEPLRRLLDGVDAFNVDLKGFDEDFYRDYVGGDLHRVLENLVKIREAGVHLEITSIVIPTLNDEIKQIKEMCKWIAAELGPEVPLHFARFYPLYKLSALPRTPASSLDKARETAMEAGLKYVYVARVVGHVGENTFCPGCGKMVIERQGFVVGEINLEQGRCVFCGSDLPGLWS